MKAMALLAPRQRGGETAEGLVFARQAEAQEIVGPATVLALEKVIGQRRGKATVPAPAKVTVLLPVKAPIARTPVTAAARGRAAARGQPAGKTG